MGKRAGYRRDWRATERFKVALGKNVGWEDHKLLLHCHIYIQHVLILFVSYSTCLLRICYCPIPPWCLLPLPSGVVHLLSSPRDLFAVSVFPCYPKEMRCDWSRRLIAIDFSHVEYLHFFAIQLGNRNSFSPFLSLWVESTQFSSIRYF
jgi:hypothetical protein